MVTLNLSNSTANFSPQDQAYHAVVKQDYCHRHDCINIQIHSSQIFEIKDRVQQEPPCLLLFQVSIVRCFLVFELLKYFIPLHFHHVELPFDLVLATAEFPPMLWKSFLVAEHEIFLMHGIRWN